MATTSVPLPVPRAVLCALLALSPACGHDAADRLYLEALRGEESGMTREQQIACSIGRSRSSPSASAYWETRGLYRIDRRDFDRALHDLDRALALAERPYLHFLRGLVLCQSGHADRALGDFDAAIAAQPENSQFYRGRSLARLETGQPEAALRDAEHLVAVVPQQAESHFARGRALAALGRCREAIPSFDEAIRRRPELAYPLAARADAASGWGTPPVPPPTARRRRGSPRRARAAPRASIPSATDPRTIDRDADRALLVLLPAAVAAEGPAAVRRRPRVRAGG